MHEQPNHHPKLTQARLTQIERRRIKSPEDIEKSLDSKFKHSGFMEPRYCRRRSDRGEAMLAIVLAVIVVTWVAAKVQFEREVSAPAVSGAIR